MKITHIIAAATMLAGLGVSTAASAQDYRDYRSDGYQRRYDDRRDDRRYDDRYDRRDRGRHYGWNGGRNRCHTEWRHHRRVTVCYR